MASETHDWYGFFWDNLPNVEAKHAQDLAILALAEFPKNPAAQLLIISLDRAELDESRGVYNTDYGPDIAAGGAGTSEKAAEKAFTAMERIGLASPTTSGPAHKWRKTYDININLILAPTPEVLQLFEPQIVRYSTDIVDSIIKGAKRRIAERAKYAEVAPTGALEAIKAAVEREAQECRESIARSNAEFAAEKAAKAQRKAERGQRKAEKA